MKDFLTNPPGWLLIVLWVSFAYTVTRLFLKLSVVQRLTHASMMARMNNLPIEFASILGMTIRGSDPVTVLSAFRRSRREGLDIAIDGLEAHCLAGGDIGAVIEALSLAKSCGKEFRFEQAAAIDLSGKDVVAETQQALGVRPPSAEDFLRNNELKSSQQRHPED